MRVYNGTWQAVGPTTAEQTNINTVAGIAAKLILTHQLQLQHKELFIRCLQQQRT